MKTLPLLLFFAVVQEDRDLFPTQEGCSWLYNLDGEDVTVTIVGKEKVGDQECTVFRKESEKGAAKELFAVTEKGVFFYPGGDRFKDNPVPRLKFGTKKGDTWEWKAEDQEGKYEHQGEEEIEVPAGKFKGIKIHVTAEGGGQRYEVTRWYAAGIGVVKEETTRGGKTSTLELKKFEEGK